MSYEIRLNTFYEIRLNTFKEYNYYINSIQFHMYFGINWRYFAMYNNQYNRNQYIKFKNNIKSYEL